MTVVDRPPRRVVRRLTGIVGSTVSLQPAGVVEPWSGTWLVQTDHARYFLKRTPRSVPEADVVSVISEITPSVVPSVVAGDLDPGPHARWFLLADRGDCDRSPLPAEASARVATLLGALQRRCAGAARLRHLLPSCLASELHGVAVDCCRWAQSGKWEPVEGAFLSEAERRLHALKEAALQVETVLAAVPQTIVHGDLWPGNIARADGRISLVDWGSSLWGIGTVDVVNLIVCRPEPLDEAGAVKVWEGFEFGFEGEVDEEARRASLVAHIVASLLIDRRVAESIGHPPQWLRGVVPGIRGLVSALESWPVGPHG